MKVIILAAGIGNRLGGSAGDKPKSLIEIDQISLLERHVRYLKEHGLQDIYVVSGFQQELMLAKLNELGIADKNIVNPQFRLGSAISLHCAKEVLSSSDDILLMDADVLYAGEILQRLVNTENKNCFLLDRDFETGEEPVKLCVKDGLLIDFRKKIHKDLEYDFQGESVGFFKFSAVMSEKLLARLQHYIDSELNEAPYEEAIRDLLLAEPERFSFEDITGLPWIEIDFPEDLIRARTEILTQIQALEN